MRQNKLKEPALVDSFKARMLTGQWDFAGQGKSSVYWRHENTVWVSEGHHRTNAALEIGRASGDWSFLDRLLEHGFCIEGPAPHGNRGRFPTRRWLSSLLLWLGW